MELLLTGVTKKVKTGESGDKFDERMSWLRQILEWQQDHKRKHSGIHGESENQLV